MSPQKERFPEGDKARDGFAPSGDKPEQDVGSPTSEGAGDGETFAIGRKTDENSVAGFGGLSDERKIIRSKKGSLPGLPKGESTVIKNK